VASTPSLVKVITSVETEVKFLQTKIPNSKILLSFGRPLLSYSLVKVVF
jgi:hypothetical protein